MTTVNPMGGDDDDDNFFGSTVNKNASGAAGDPNKPKKSKKRKPAGQAGEGDSEAGPKPKKAKKTKSEQQGEGESWGLRRSTACSLVTDDHHCAVPATEDGGKAKPSKRVRKPKATPATTAAGTPSTTTPAPEVESVLPANTPALRQVDDSEAAADAMMDDVL